MFQPAARLPHVPRLHCVYLLSTSGTSCTCRACSSSSSTCWSLRPRQDSVCVRRSMRVRSGFMTIKLPSGSRTSCANTRPPYRPCARAPSSASACAHTGARDVCVACAPPHVHSLQPRPRAQARMHTHEPVAADKQISANAKGHTSCVLRTKEIRWPSTKITCQVHKENDPHRTHNLQKSLSHTHNPSMYATFLPPCLIAATGKVSSLKWPLIASCDGILGAGNNTEKVQMQRLMM